jgi:hypothetical protein
MGEEVEESVLMRTVMASLLPSARAAADRVGCVGRP